MKNRAPVRKIRKLVRILKEASEAGVGAEITLEGVWEADAEGEVDLTGTVTGSVPVDLPVDAEVGAGFKRTWENTGTGTWRIRLFTIEPSFRGWDKGGEG